MKIKKAIQKVKAYHLGTVDGKKIDDNTTRDQILFHENDDLEQNVTRIVTCVYPSIDVIKEAIAFGANFIISHESLFWNHGDHVDWLEANKNKTYQIKENLLKENHIVVWRDHDYIHSGIPVGDLDIKYTDGIFYGFAKEMNWLRYASGNQSCLDTYKIPQTTAKDLANFLIQKMNLNGTRIIGNPNAKVSKVTIPFHIFGDAKDDITDMDQDKVDVFLTMELVDFTLTEYVKDSAQAGRDKAIITLGHFNFEEQGMKYMPHWLPDALQEKIPIKFIQATDMYHFLEK